MEINIDSFLFQKNVYLKKFFKFLILHNFIFYNRNQLILKSKYPQCHALSNGIKFNKKKFKNLESK